MSGTCVRDEGPGRCLHQTRPPPPGRGVPRLLPWVIPAGRSTPDRHAAQRSVVSLILKRQPGYASEMWSPIGK
jgi:hypothetical protein